MNTIIRGTFRHFLLIIKCTLQVFKKVIIRTYELFPKKYGPFGFGVLYFTMGQNFNLIYIILLNNRIISEEAIGGLFLLAVIISFIFIMFIMIYFSGKRDYEIVLKNEQAKGAQYNRKWKIITLCYLILSWIIPYILS